MSKQDIQARLQDSSAFLKTHPKYKGRLMINCMLNCKGELVQCSIDNPSGEKELDNEILELYKTFKTWTPGSLQGENVDCIELVSFEIKKGKITVQ